VYFPRPPSRPLAPPSAKESGRQGSRTCRPSLPLSPTPHAPPTPPLPHLRRNTSREGSRSSRRAARLPAALPTSGRSSKARATRTCRSSANEKVAPKTGKGENDQTESVAQKTKSGRGHMSKSGQGHMSRMDGCSPGARLIWYSHYTDTTLHRYRTHKLDFQ